MEGIIHVSDISWLKKPRKASDLVKSRDVVAPVIVGLSVDEGHVSLELKQALVDPSPEARGGAEGVDVEFLHLRP
jgi:small subunit ribosomal protein S1